MLGPRGATWSLPLVNIVLDGYFSLARGDVRRNIPALEMTKWFDTNYHYLVPEIDGGTWTSADHPVVADTSLAGEYGFRPKPALIGPFTWLALGKAGRDVRKWDRLEEIAAAYVKILSRLAPLCDYIQLEEPNLLAVFENLFQRKLKWMGHGEY